MLARQRLSRRQASVIGCAAAIAMIVKSPARGLDIVLNYSSSVTSLPNAAQFEAATSYAAQQYDEMFTNSETVNITVQAANGGTGSGAFLGKSQEGTIFAAGSYTVVRNALVASATTADQLTNIADNWPTTDPTGSNSQWDMTFAEANAIGLTTANPPASYGTFTFNSAFTYTYDPYNRAVSGSVDFIGVAEHELSEIMGRVPGFGFINSSNQEATYYPFDLTHYNGAGVRDLTGAKPGDYFSIDGGNTNLKAFNSNSTGDLTDWATLSPYVPDSYNAFSNGSVANTITPVDATVMDVLGYNRSSTALTFVGGTNDFLTGFNWESGDSTALNPFHGATMLVNDPQAIAYHEFTPGENFVLASNSDMGQSMEVTAGFLELNDSGQVTGNGFGLLVNQDGTLIVGGTGNLYPQGPVSIGDAAGVTNAIAQFTGSSTVIIGNPAEVVTLYVGNDGTGNVAQTGAANVTTPELVVGNDAGSHGIYQLDTTGTLDVTGDEVVASNGFGDFLQIAGTNKIVGSLVIASGFGTGTFELEGGAVTAAAVDVDSDQFSTGFTSLTQSGGTLTASVVTVDQVAAFYLSNGTCSAAVVNAGVFDFSGGLVIGNITNTGRFTYTGGTLFGSFTNDGVTNLDANLTVPYSMLNEAPLTISSGITLTVDLSGIDNESTLTLAGGTLAGSGTKTNDYAIQGAGTITGSGALVNNGTIAESGGSIVLSMAGNPDYNYGTIVLQSTTGELALTSLSNPNTDRLINSGMVYLDGSVIDGGGGFENASGGTVFGPGKFNNDYFLNDSGGTISIPAGTLNIVPVLTNSGTIDLTDPAANLAGTHGISNSGTLEGIGTVSAGITNTGTIQPGNGTLTLNSLLALGASNLIVNTGGTLLVLGVGNGLPTNGGTITLAGGTFDNDGYPMINSGLITGYGTLNTGGLTNGIAAIHEGSMALSGGSSTINGNVTNVRTITLTNGFAEFTGNVGGTGTFVNSSGYAIFDGTYTGASYSSTDSNNAFANNVTIPSGGSMTSSSDSNIYISGGTTFTNGGTFTNTGLLACYNPTINNGTFSQTGSLVQGADFTNNGTATIGGSQDWLPGTNFNNTAGTATFQTDAGSPSSATLNVNITGGTVSLASPQHWVGLTISGNGILDVANNHVIINYGTGPDPIASIVQYLDTGYANGAWNGAGGIISSVAQITSGYGLGYADSADSGNPANLPSGTIEIAYTLLGDADLNGIVNGIDFGILAANFNKGVSSWDQGDFDYNNIVNGIDFGDLAANFNKGASGADLGPPAYDDPEILAFAAANGLLADVPEPASVGLLTVAVAGILARRRRR